MSLYNQMCGNNPLFGIYARVLETAGEVASIPRFRDMYTREESGKAQIVIYTRTGGGNRDDYAAQNDALTEHPLYVTDFDDDFDSTFAHFVFDVPEAFAERMLRLHRAFSKFPKGMAPKAKYDRALASIKGEQPDSLVPTDSEVDELQGAIAAIVTDLPEEPSTVEKSLA